MILRSLSSSLPTFRTLEFHDGLNILLAEKTRPAGGRRETRNGTGKSSALRLLRYMLGASKADELQSPSLQSVDFTLVVDFNNNGRLETVSVKRNTVSTKVKVEGWSSLSGEYTQKAWAAAVRSTVFRVPEELDRPTLSQMRAQALRTSFDPVKINPSESDWEAGTRIGFLLGLDVSRLMRAGVVAKLKTQQRALTSAKSDGAFDGLDMNSASVESQLATARLRRNRMHEQIDTFVVDDLYREHQESANQLSLTIRDLSDQALALGSRQKSLEAALSEMVDGRGVGPNGTRLEALYAELGVMLPTTILRRYEEVVAFHESVVRNRQEHLNGELERTRVELRAIEDSRKREDYTRSQLMELLATSVAFATYERAVEAAAEVAGQVAQLEQQLSFTRKIDSISDEIHLQSVAARQAVVAELAENSEPVDFARTRFVDLAEEVYGPPDGNAKQAALRIGASSSSGHLVVEPEITSDRSQGISSVKTCLLDLILTETALKADRSAGFLVHDSHLFDAIDSEQVADCLNIGARLADSEGFQYIVTMNSDALKSAVAESNDGFDPDAYLLGTVLSDVSDDKRLFGMQLA